MRASTRRSGPLSGSSTPDLSGDASPDTPRPQQRRRRRRAPCRARRPDHRRTTLPIAIPMALPNAMNRPGSGAEVMDRRAPAITHHLCAVQQRTIAVSSTPDGRYQSRKSSSGERDGCSSPCSRRIRLPDRCPCGPSTLLATSPSIYWEREGPVNRRLRCSPDSDDPFHRPRSAQRVAVGNVILFDALSTEEYRSAHIPGTLSMPPGLVDRAVVRTGVGFRDRRVRLQRRM